MSKPGADVRIDNQGTLWVFYLRTDEASEWWEAHVDSPPYMSLGNGIHCADWRCAQAIAEGMIAAGFLVSTD